MCQTFLANSFFFFPFYLLVPSSPTSWKYLCIASPRFSKIQWKKRRGTRPIASPTNQHKLPEELEQPKRTEILLTFMIYFTAHSFIYLPSFHLLFNEYCLSIDILQIHHFSLQWSCYRVWVWPVRDYFNYGLCVIF